jgi:endo-1,4-beta-xylanase
MSAENIEAHMKMVSERYDSSLYAWDVVNEAIDDKGDMYLRKTKWLENLGQNYLTDVFKRAGKYVAGTDLYYNDYNDASPTKRVKIARLINELKANGAPVTGLGLQAHYNIYSPTLDEIKESIELYAGLGVKLSITEMDVSMFRFEDHSSLPAPTADLIEKQAEYYRGCFKIFREYKEHIDSVTLWGVADDATWLDHFPVRGRKNWPLLFDEGHNPKEAFWRVVDF